MERDVLVVRDGQRARAFDVMGERIVVLLNRKQTGGHEVVLHVGQEGAGPPPHFHPWDEDFYVIEGEIEFSYEGRIEMLGAGDFIHFPAGMAHAFRHVSAGARALGISSASGAVEFFAAVDRIKGEPANFERMAALAHSHGVEVVGPPK